MMVASSEARGSVNTGNGGWRRWIRPVLSVAVIAVLVFVIDWGRFLRLASTADVRFILLAALVICVQNLTIAWRWKVLLGPVGVNARFIEALRSYLKGHFIAYFVPAAVMADVVKAADLHHSRSHGVEVISSIFLERGFGAITVGTAVLLGLTLSPLVGEHDNLQHALVFGAAAVVFCCCLALFADRFIRVIPTAWLERFPKIAEILGRIEDAFAAYRRSPGILLGVMLLSVAIQAMRIVAVFVIGVSVGAGHAIFPYVIAVPVVYLLGTIPVVGSRIGTEQGLFVLLLGLGGISAESALAVAVMVIFLGILASLPGGYWLTKGRSVPDER